MKLPLHKCGLYLTHNNHKGYYETAETYIKHLDEQNDNLATSWPSEEDKINAIKTDSIWALQWYPETPIGFHLIYASTLDGLLELASRIEQD